jgi:hypothetical protein
MIYENAPLDRRCRVTFTGTKGAAMYELLGALAFATLVVGYILALVFVQHEDGGFSRPGSIRGERDR